MEVEQEKTGKCRRKIQKRRTKTPKEPQTHAERLARFLATCQKMEEIFLAGKTKDYAIFMDLEGTLIPKRDPRDKKKTRIRPGSAFFHEQISQVADVYLYTAASRHQTDALLRTTFRRGFAGVFDRQFLTHNMKCPHRLSHLTRNLVIVTNTPVSVRSDSRQFCVPIKTWRGEEDDIEMLGLYEKVSAILFG